MNLFYKKDRYLVNSSPFLTCAYIDFVLSGRDIDVEVFKQIYSFYKIAI